MSEKAKILGNAGLSSKGNAKISFMSEHDENNSNDNQGHGGQTSGAVDTLQRVTVPKMYKVVLLNDDYTPMDFVVLVLQRFFGKSQEQATHIMLDVHKKGSGLAGVFTLEVAEMKVMQVNQFARNNQHPLKCTMEAE